MFFIERGANDRQTAWDKQCSANSLDSTGDYQLAYRRRQTAQYRCRRKHHYAENVYPTPAIMVAKRTSGQ